MDTMHGNGSGRRRIGHWLALLGLLLVGGGFALPTLVDAPKRLFILHSYAMDHLCGWPQHQGVVQGLAQAGFTGNSIEFGVFATDIRRRYNRPEQIRERAALALEGIQTF